MAVYFSPSSDIFQPVPEVLELSYSVLEFLLSIGIGVAFVTKGRIPEQTLDLLLRHAEKVRVQIGIITDDDRIRQIFEPNTASVDLRFAQMAIMAAGGIGVEARIIPILPGDYRFAGFHQFSIANDIEYGSKTGGNQHVILKARNY